MTFLPYDENFKIFQTQGKTSKVRFSSRRKAVTEAIFWKIASKCRIRGRKKKWKELSTKKETVKQREKGQQSRQGSQCGKFEKVRLVWRKEGNSIWHKGHGIGVPRDRKLERQQKGSCRALRPRQAAGSLGRQQEAFEVLKIRLLERSPLGGKAGGKHIAHKAIC